MRADLHTHTIFSDGELCPAELVRRAMVLGHDVIAITDHVDMTNVEIVASNVAKACEMKDDYIPVIPGVEITHVPPRLIGDVAKRARKAGAEWIVVHGETVTEPVAPGTNKASAENPDIDVLAHPGFITIEEAEAAKENGVLLEITGRAGHNITNGHVCCIARKVGAEMVVDSDTHQPENLMDEKAAYTVALGAGLTQAEADRAIQKTPFDILRSKGLLRSQTGPVNLFRLLFSETNGVVGVLRACGTHRAFDEPGYVVLAESEIPYACFESEIGHYGGYRGADILPVLPAEHAGYQCVTVPAARCVHGTDRRGYSRQAPTVRYVLQTGQRMFYRVGGDGPFGEYRLAGKGGGVRYKIQSTGVMDVPVGGEKTFGKHLQSSEADGVRFRILLEGYV